MPEQIPYGLYLCALDYKPTQLEDLALCYPMGLTKVKALGVHVLLTSGTTKRSL